MSERRKTRGNLINIKKQGELRFTGCQMTLMRRRRRPGRLRGIQMAVVQISCQCYSSFAAKLMF